MLTQKQKALREQKRVNASGKKFKIDKLGKKVATSFRSLNNKNCYDFLDDEKSSTRQNLADFLTYLEKYLIKYYGTKAKKWDKEEVQRVLHIIFPEPTDRQFETLRVLNKHIKKNKDVYKSIYSIVGLFEGKSPDNAWRSMRDDIYDDY